MSGSNRRPASRSGPRLLRILLGCWLAAAAGAGLAAPAAPVPAFAPGVRSGPRESGWLTQDRRWLARLPAGRWAAPAADDSLAALRRWIAAAADPADSLTRALPLAELLRERWLQRGRPAAAVFARGDTLFVDPGPVFRYRRLEVQGEEFPGRGDLLELWLPRPGQEYDPEALARALARILAGAGEAGHPFARWVTRQVTVEPASAAVDVTALLLPGTRAVIGPVTSDLPRGRSRDFLALASGLRPGAAFVESDLAAAVQRLQARDLYAAVGRPRVYLTSAPDTVGVHIPVTPRLKVNRLHVVLGFNRNAEDGRGRVSGQVDLDLPNLSGSGRKLRVGWLDDGARRARFGFAYGEPLALGTPLDLDLSLDHEVQTDLYTRFRADQRWSLPVVALWGIELGLGWDRVTYPAGAVEGTRRTRARGAVRHRRGDRAQSGWEGLFAVETAWRASRLRGAAGDTALTGGDGLGAGATQTLFEADLGGEVWLAPAWSLSGRAAYRRIDGGAPDTPLAEQYRFGGANTLRGYAEDEFNGSTAAWGALELRIGRAGGSRLYTFCDLGYFEFSALAPLPEDPLHRELRQGRPRGYGLGLLARTPGGDLSLAVGFPGTVDFDLAKLHVSLLESF